MITLRAGVIVRVSINQMKLPESGDGYRLDDRINWSLPGN
jgi:hypothetical protein